MCSQLLPMPYKISVVTPTLCRSLEVSDLLENLSKQTCLPFELILVDGSSAEDKRTEKVVQEKQQSLPFIIQYIRHTGGTAIQRNVGIDQAQGDFIAFIDDDIRLDPDFFEQIMTTFDSDPSGAVGGITGYISNQYLDPAKSPHWRWYKKLHLLKTYEPGRYDFETGAPVNRYLQAPHDCEKEIDFMGAGCAIWRSEVFRQGLRFSRFFTGYGVLEDAHLALRAGKTWILLENGKARCIHLHSQVSRPNERIVTRISTINHRYVFMDIVPKRTFSQEYRFWRLHFFDLIRILAFAIQHPFEKRNWKASLGKLEGLWLASLLRSSELEKYK